MTKSKDSKILTDKAKRVIAKAAAMGGVLSVASPTIRKMVHEAAEYQAAMEIELAQANALGVSVKEYRIIQALPADWIDWSKVGFKKDNE